MRLTQSAAAVSEPKSEGKYLLYDGMISGEYKEVVENERIIMKWRMKDWKEGEYSQVELKFSDGGDNNCEISLTQTEIPEYDQFDKFVHIDNIEGGWRNMIFQRME